MAPMYTRVCASKGDVGGLSVCGHKSGGLKGLKQWGMN